MAIFRIALVCLACASALSAAGAAETVRQSVESSLRTRHVWTDLETAGHAAGDTAWVSEWREVYRRFQGDWYFKLEGAVILEEHTRLAALDSGTIRSELHAGLHWHDLYWLAEWRGRYVGRDGFDETSTRYNHFGFRVRSNVLPEPPEGVAFDIQPNFGVAYIDAWPERLNRWSSDGELEIVWRIDERFLLTVAPKVEWLHYPGYLGETRDDWISSLRASVRYRVQPGWAITLEAQANETQSSAPNADSRSVSIMPLVRNVVRF